MPLFTSRVRVGFSSSRTTRAASRSAHPHGTGWRERGGGGARGARARREGLVEQAAEARGGDEIAVHQQERVRRPGRQQAQRAGSPQGRVLAQILDPAAEPMTVLEVLLDL